MIYGMYLSAAGVVANSYRQDVISNNLANSETNGFKRDLATFRMRQTEAQATGRLNETNPLLEKIGGGILAMPTLVDAGQGDLEETGNNLDVAIQGSGFFTVSDGKSTKLTRDGQFVTDAQGMLVMSTNRGHRVLDKEGSPIKLDMTKSTLIGQDGSVNQDGKLVAKIGLVDVNNPEKLVKFGGQFLTLPDMKAIAPSSATLQCQFVEHSNVNPATELTQLIETQRQLEANANMIRYQDSMLDKLVNQVGRIG